MPLLKHLAKLDIPGGGQVVAEGDYAYIGHMGPPDGTSIVDVSDPRRPRVTSRIEIPSFMHSHKVRVNGDVMMVNQELFRAKAAERPDGWPAASSSTTSRTRPTRARSGTTNRAARTVSIRMSATPISRRRKRAISATSL